MARIIKIGEKRKSVFRGTCKNCCSLIEEDQENLTVNYDRNEFMAQLRCPHCQSSMWVYPFYGTNIP